MESVLPYLQALVSITVILGFIWGIINYALVVPINKQLVILDTSINNLNKVIDKVINDNHELDKKLAIQERSVSALHSRIDTLVEFCKGTHGHEVSYDSYCAMKGVSPGRTTLHKNGGGSDDQ